MGQKELYQSANEVLEYLRKENVGTVPEVLVGYNVYPTPEQIQFGHQVQALLFEYDLVKNVGNSLNGFYELNRTDAAILYRTIEDRIENKYAKRLNTEPVKVLLSPEQQFLINSKDDKPKWQKILEIVGIVVGIIVGIAGVIFAAMQL